MPHLHLFATGEEGFELLRAAVKMCKERISFVFIDHNNGMAYDFYHDLVDLCVKEGLTWGSRDMLSKIKPDRLPNEKIAIAVKWRHLIPTHKYSTILVLHDSLLPSLAGFNPLVTAIQSGDLTSGVTCFIATEIVDSGPVYMQVPFRLDPLITITEATSKALNAYKEIFTDIFVRLSSSPVEFASSLSQLGNDRGLTACSSTQSYSVWRDQFDYVINWACSSIDLDRHIRSSTTPYLGALSLTSKGALVRIHKSFSLHESLMPRYVNPTPGKVIDVQEGCPVVMCGEGYLRISEVIDEATGKDITMNIRPRTRFLESILVHSTLIPR